MPKREVLERYDVLEFHEIACALKEGNVMKFDNVIAKHEAFLINCGIYLIVEKLKIIAYRNLFKRVCLIDIWKTDNLMIQFQNMINLILKILGIQYNTNSSN